MKGINRGAVPALPTEVMQPVSSIPAGTEAQVAYIPTVDDVYDAFEKGIDLHPVSGVIVAMEDGSETVIPNLGMPTVREIGRTERSTRAPKAEHVHGKPPILKGYAAINEGLQEVA